MTAQVRMRDLIASAYDAATGAAPWEAFLTAVGEALPAPVTVLFSQLPGHRESAFLGATGLDSGTIREYREHFSTRNILMTLGEAQHVPGVVRTTETICSAGALLDSEYYNDFMRPRDTRYSMALTPIRDGDRAIHLSAFRPHGASAFGAAEIHAFAELSPHLRRALQVHTELMEKEQRASALEEVVGRSGKGVAFLRSDGRITYANDALRRMSAMGDGLTLAPAGIHVSVSTEACALRALIVDAARGGSGGALAISRFSGKLAFVVFVTPRLRRIGFAGRVELSAVVTVSDPSAAADANVLMLQRVYGLTRAEARVAARLASGGTLRAIAEQLAISVLTARTHVKRALAKTATHRQIDLVRLVADLR